MNLHFDPKFDQVYLYSCLSHINTIAVLCCDTALEPDFLAISSQDALTSTCVVIIQRHDNNICWSCPLPTIFSPLRLELPTELPTM